LYNDTSLYKWQFYSTVGTSSSLLLTKEEVYTQAEDADCDGGYRLIKKLDRF